jgi:hypothetical protein
MCGGTVVSVFCIERGRSDVVETRQRTWEDRNVGRRSVERYRRSCSMNFAAAQLTTILFDEVCLRRSSQHCVRLVT